MASRTGAVWAIDLGNESLKALQLRDLGDGAVEVIGFDHVHHGKILDNKEITRAEREELIAMTMRQFVSRNNLGKDDVVISMPSQNSFARFVTLPPVAPGGLLQIIKFEAAQQIPFDINEVQWDWQLMSDPEESSDLRAGIFAIKNEIIDSELEHFTNEGIRVSHVQMAPLALYNYILFDRPELTSSDTKATAILNIGSETTDLVICTKSTVWQRSIPMGGNAFTKAIADTFKLNFAKAEKLKRTAAMSKYARQIFSAMKPVFTDLASEIQRSIGFYRSSNPNVTVTGMIALGGGTKMRGLLKYLQQNLQLQIERPDSFKRLHLNESVSAPKFHENANDFGVVYGLAIQAFGYAKIESNLLPKAIGRSMIWTAKAGWFTVAAVLLLAVALAGLGRTMFDRVSYAHSSNESVRRQNSRVVQQARSAVDSLESEQRKSEQYQRAIQNNFSKFQYRELVPKFHEVLISKLPNENIYPEQAAVFAGYRMGDFDAIMSVPRRERKQIFVTNLLVEYSDDLASATFPELGTQTRSSSRSRGGGAFGGMPGADTGGFGGYSSTNRGRSQSRSDRNVRTQEEPNKGFVVTMAGYTPYHNPVALFDPAGVVDNIERWGYVTRLLNLNPNGPFQLYDKTSMNNFKLEIGVVDLGAQMPLGIGISDTRFPENTSGFNEDVLRDPFTKEFMSTLTVLNANGRERLDSQGRPLKETNDSWFILKAKFLWNEEGQAAGEDQRQDDN